MFGTLKNPIDILDSVYEKSSYKSKFTLEQRQEDSSVILNKYPDRIPVIIEKYHSSLLLDIDRKKYLVPTDMTIGQLIFMIRKRIKLSSEKAIFIFIDNITPNTSLTIHEVYEKHKDIDNFLYIVYQEESVFG